MARKKKAAARRTTQKKATRRGSNGNDAPEAPRTAGIVRELERHIGQSVTASGLGGCYVGTLRQVHADGVVIETEDAAAVVLGLGSLELAVGSAHQSGPPRQVAGLTPDPFGAEPPTRGIPPEEDVF